jgi:tetratricopeptide (TPR) repeat protein
MSAEWMTRYKELTAKGADQLRQGEFKAAIVTFEETRRIAREMQDQTLDFRAICNVSTAKLSLGEAQQAEEGLREILLKCNDDQVVYIASSNLSSALRRQGRLEKALLYGKRALRVVEKIDNYVWKVLCHNLIGNIYMNMSYLDDATAEYRFALALGEKGALGTSYPIDYVKESLGYCLLLKKQHRQGIAMILEALQISLTNGNTRCIVECYQDLSFAYMQLKQLKLGQDYGEKALKIATEQGYKDILKNCNYLLGEIHLLLGNEEKSDWYFDRLQEFYPNVGMVKDFLRTFDVSSIINLKSPL